MITELLIGLGKGVAVKQGLKVGAKAGLKGMSVAGWAYGAYSSYKTYKTFTKNDPSNAELVKYEPEREKWASAIGCVGRESYKIGDMCSISEGGAINALGKKELFQMPNTRYPDNDGEPDMQYHADPTASKKDSETLEKKVGSAGKLEGARTVNPDPAEAKELIKRAAKYVSSAENLLKVRGFDDKKKEIVDDLRRVNRKIKTKYVAGKDYTSFQVELTEIVERMKKLEFPYEQKISELIKSRDNRRLRSGLLAGAAFFVGTISGSKGK